MQVYAPTSNHEDEQVDLFYDEVTRALNQDRAHFTVMCGDFNAKIGIKVDPSESALGKFGSPGRNQRGEALLNYLLENNLYLMNSFFQKKPQRRWTWKSPDGKTHNEIDFIITDKKYVVKDVTVLNNFTTGSDHRLIRAHVEINTHKERTKMMTRSKTEIWRPPRNEQEFQKHISNALKRTSTNDINDLSDTISHAIMEAQKICSVRTEKEERISPTTKSKIENRRALLKDKNAKQQDINDANKEVSKAIRKDIRKFKHDKTIQTIENNKSMKILRRKLATGKKEIIRLKDKNGEIKSNREEMLKIVEEFYETLYKNHMELEPNEHLTLKITNQGSEDIPDISKEEITHALSKMKNHRAPGNDGIVIEAIKCGGPVLINAIKKLFNLCLQNQTIPTQWNNSTTILIHKKGDVTNLENYRPISLLNHLYKLYTRIISNRLENKLDFYQPLEQAGFRPGFGTNDHLQCIKTLIEKTVEYNRPLSLIFVDFHKAFDTVELVSILRALKECRIDQRYSNSIYNIYKNATTTINLHTKETKKIKIKRGIRQGDTLSPKLFTAVLEHAFKNLEWENKGVTIDGEKLSHLRFADDIVLISDDLHEAREMLEELQQATKKAGLKINYNKTKMLTNLVPSELIQLENEQIEIIEKYTYLGHEIRIGRDNQTCELSRRIALGWAAFGKLADILKTNIPICLKRKAFNQCILPVLTYGAETLTLTKTSVKKLQVTQRKMERSMLGISLNDRIRNEDIRKRTGVEDIIKKLQHKSGSGRNMWPE